jgi:predicted Zn-dependent protease
VLDFREMEGETRGNAMINRFFRILPAAVMAFAIAGCASVETTKPGMVGVDRQQTMLVSSEQVTKAASEEYGKMIAAARQQGALDRDQAQVQRVRKITARLEAQTPVFRPDARNWPWEVHVISSKELNAWCMPGGKIAVYTGLIDQLQLSDAEIAAVMGHEIAHALREHARERISQQMATGVAVGVAAAVLGVGQAGADIGGMLANVMFNLPNSRTHEQEADRIGVELAARAGFDPRGAVTVWQKMAKASGGGTPEFLSTHPSPETRIKDLEGYSQRVMPLYEQARKGVTGG